MVHVNLVYIHGRQMGLVFRMARGGCRRYGRNVNRGSAHLAVPCEGGGEQESNVILFFSHFVSIIIKEFGINVSLLLKSNSIFNFLAAFLGFKGVLTSLSVTVRGKPAL